MNDQNYTATFSVDQTPEEVFAAINNVRGWWTGEIKGSTDQLGDEWTYRHGDVHYSKQRVVELVPGQLVVWQVVDASLNFVENKKEWQGTQIRFDITRLGNQTQLRFTHVGLAPHHECYDACSDAWGFYIKGSLRGLITTGQGEPSQKEKGAEEKVAP